MLVASGQAKPRLEEQGTKPSVFFIEQESKVLRPAKDLSGLKSI